LFLYAKKEVFRIDVEWIEDVRMFRGRNDLQEKIKVGSQGLLTDARLHSEHAFVHVVAALREGTTSRS
jgi:hypothetical protein